MKNTILININFQDRMFPLKGFSKGRWYKKQSNWENIRFNADRFDLSGVLLNTSIVVREFIF